VFVVRGDYLALHPVRAHQLCDAWRQSLTAFDDPVSRAWVAARMGVTESVLDAMTTRIHWVSWADNQKLRAGDRGSFLATAAQTAEQLAALGVAAGPVRIEALLEWPAGLEDACGK
jgi:hypothetical protein